MFLKGYNKLGKILQKIFIILLYAFIALVLFQQFYPVKINDRDLIYYPPKVKDEDNAYIKLLPWLKNMNDKQLRRQIRALANSRDFDKTKAEEILSLHQPLLEVFHQALLLDYFRPPSEIDGVYNRKSEGELLKTFFLSSLQVIYIKKLINENKYPEAFYEISRLAKWARMLDDSGEIYIYGLTNERRTIGLIREWAEKASFDRKYYRGFRKEIESFLKNGTTEEFIRIDYTTTLISMRLASGDNPYNLYDKGKINKFIPIKYIYNREATRNDLAGCYRRILVALEGNYRDISNIGEPLLFRNRLLKGLRYLSGNIVGKILVKILIPNHVRMMTGDILELNAQGKLTKLFLALKDYYAGQKTLPKNLAVLVPDYIEAIPKDPYDNKELKYSPKEKIIYSAGYDILSTEGCLAGAHGRHGCSDEALRIKLNFGSN